MSSSLTDEITVPGRAELQEVWDGIYAYVQPDLRTVGLGAGTG